SYPSPGASRHPLPQGERGSRGAFRCVGEVAPHPALRATLSREGRGGHPALRATLSRKGRGGPGGGFGALGKLPLTRRCAPPSPARGEGDTRRFAPPSPARGEGEPGGSVGRLRNVRIASAGSGWSVLLRQVQDRPQALAL